MLKCYSSPLKPPLKKALKYFRFPFPPHIRSGHQQISLLLKQLPLLHRHPVVPFGRHRRQPDLVRISVQHGIARVNAARGDAVPWPINRHLLEQIRIAEVSWAQDWNRGLLVHPIDGSPFRGRFGLGQGRCAGGRIVVCL